MNVRCSSTAPLGEIGQEVGYGTLARVDRRFICRISADRSLRWPAEERHCALDRKVEADLRRAQRSLLKRDVVAVHEYQCVALVYIDRSELCRNAAPIGSPLELVDRENAQPVIGQGQQPLPPRRTNRADLVRLRDEHAARPVMHDLVACGRIAFAGVARIVGSPVGPVPDDVFRPVCLRRRLRSGRKGGVAGPIGNASNYRLQRRQQRLGPD
jgi:hypothetical protein